MCGSPMRRSELQRFRVILIGITRRLTDLAHTYSIITQASFERNLSPSSAAAARRVSSPMPILALDHARAATCFEPKQKAPNRVKPGG